MYILKFVKIIICMYTFCNQVQFIFVNWFTVGACMKKNKGGS